MVNLEQREMCLCAFEALGDLRLRLQACQAVGHSSGGRPDSVLEAVSAACFLADFNLLLYFTRSLTVIQREVFWTDLLGSYVERS